MRRTWIIGMTAGLFGGLLVAVPAQAHSEEGCAQGYWKNSTDNWFEAPGDPISTSLLLNSERVGFEPTSAFAGDTLLDALNYGGGSGLAGAEQILFRAAAAAWLNAASEDVDYPYRRFDTASYGIVSTVNTAIASGDRATMLQVADELDAANNLGCPL